MTITTTGIIITNTRIGECLQTRSGKRVYPLDPRQDEIDGNDIAHALSHICRFAGHVRIFHSVAFHSVLVSELVATFHPGLALAAMYHDAAEAYIADIPRPVKRGLRTIRSQHAFGTCTETMEQTEERLLRCIFAALSIPWPDEAGWKLIYHADDAVLRAEAEQLMPAAEWTKQLPEPPSFLCIGYLAPEDARRRFTARASQLIARKAA